MNGPARFDSSSGMWVVENPNEVRQVLLDPETFRPDNALTAFTPIGVEALRTLTSVGFALPPTLANNASGTHRVIRQTVAGYFSPSRVLAATSSTRALSEDRFHHAATCLLSGETIDLVPTTIGEVPALVLLELLSVEGIDIRQLKQWSIDSLELFWGRPDSDRQEVLANSAAEFYAWLRTLTQAARNGHGSDFFRELVGLALTDEEICAIGYFLLIAGQETTAQLVSTVIWRTLQDRELWRSIGGRPELASVVVEQALQEDSSVPTWRRYVSQPAVIGSVALPAGASVLLKLTGTGAPPDLAFGVGVHRCLGARLARMEATVALEAAARILPGLELAEVEPPMIDLLSFRAPRRVLVTSSDDLSVSRRSTAALRA